MNDENKEKIRKHLYNIASDMENFDDDTLDSVINLVLRQEEFSQHKGFKHKRIKDNPREKAFYDEWLKENEPITGLNYGYGTLQDLFFEPGENIAIRQAKCMEVINERDRYIVATVIQWLGTNCGMSFLHAALNKCGYKIIKKD